MKRRSLNVVTLLVLAVSACGQEASHKAADALDQTLPVAIAEPLAAPNLTVDVIPPPSGTVYLVRFNLIIKGLKGPLFVSLTTFGACDFHPVLNLDLTQAVDHTTRVTGYLSLDTQDCRDSHYHAVLSIDKRGRPVSVEGVDFEIGR